MKLFIAVLYIVLTALAAQAAGIPNQIDEDTAKELLDSGKPAYRCKDVEVDQGSVTTIGGDDIFTTTKPEGTKKKNTVRKGIKKGEKYVACQPLRINENTDSVANKRKSKPVYVKVN